MDVGEFLFKTDDLVKKGREVEVVKLARRFSKRRKNKVAELLINKGVEIGDQGDNERALTYFRLSRKISMSDGNKIVSSVLISTSYFNMGVNLYNSDKKGEAEKKFKEAIEFNPKNAEAHYILGHILYENGESVEAEKEFKETIKYKEDYTEAYTFLGVILHQRNEKGKAENLYRIALYHKPDYADAHYNYGVLLLEYGQKGGAEKEFRETIKNNPNDAEANANLGFLLFESNDYSGAKIKFENSSKIFSERKNDFDFRKMKGYTLWTEALQFWRENDFDNSKTKYNEASQVFGEIKIMPLANYLNIVSKFIFIDEEFKGIIASDNICAQLNRMDKLMESIKKIEICSELPEREIFKAKISCFEIFFEILKQCEKMKLGKRLDLSHIRTKIQHPMEIFEKMRFEEEAKQVSIFESLIALFEEGGMRWEEQFSEEARKLIIFDGTTTQKSQSSAIGDPSKFYNAIMSKIELSEKKMNRKMEEVMQTVREESQKVITTLSQK
jgi:Flp pilus assembly protein TadD